MIRIFILVVVAAALGAFLFGGEGSVSETLLQAEEGLLTADIQELAALAAMLALLVIVLPAVFGGYKERVGGAVRDLLSWTALGLILVAGYSYRDELGRIAFRIAGEFSPPGASLSVEQRQAGERAVRIRRRGDGHFVARVSVDGASVSMLVDTGASTVVLRQSDARLLGVDTRRLRYTVPVQTANGLAYAAHARLREVAIGSITLHNVDALVAQPGALKESLLGMSFLSRLRSYEFAGDFVTFRN
ncbi:MAG: TIGR02281 family clan AA aspartic protease [Hyphomicrobiaceae bacterium]